MLTAEVGTQRLVVVPPAPAMAPCAHCGLAVPRGMHDEGAARQFCCAGCRAVYAALHEHGLEHYYALRASADEASLALPRTPAPARTTDKSYAEMDDPGFRERSCWPAPGGLMQTELYLEGAHCSARVWVGGGHAGACPRLVGIRLGL